MLRTSSLPRDSDVFDRWRITKSSKQSFATMTRFTGLLLALTLASLSNNVEALFGRSSLSIPGRWSNPKTAFGLVEKVTRGGASDSTEADTKEGAEGEPVDLYLPGLLEASISKSKKVSLVLAVV